MHNSLIFYLFIAGASMFAYGGSPFGIVLAIVLLARAYSLINEIDWSPGYEIAAISFLSALTVADGIFVVLPRYIA